MIEIFGEKGCGKSERMRKLSGLTYDQFEINWYQIEISAEKMRKYRELLDNVRQWWYGDME
jgi:ABC-type siderophore export system fused ATPase/permease subunit